MINHIISHGSILLNGWSTRPFANGEKNKEGVMQQWGTKHMGGVGWGGEKTSGVMTKHACAWVCGVCVRGGGDVW